MSRVGKTDSLESIIYLLKASFAAVAISTTMNEASGEVMDVADTDCW